MNQNDLEQMTQQVYELCSSRRLSEIRIDLQKTNSVEVTLERIWEGGFLEGTIRDPSLKTHIILDSDDEVEVEDLTTSLSLRQRSPSPWDMTATEHTVASPSPARRRSPTPIPMNTYDSDNDSLPSASQLMNKIYSAEPHKASSQPSSAIIFLDDSDGDAPIPSPPRPSSAKIDMDYLKQWDDIEIDLSTDTVPEQRSISEPPKKGNSRSQQIREEKARLRQEQQEQKKREREQKKAEKERKKLLEQANKLRNNRQEMLAEMIVDVDTDFAESSHGQLLRESLIAKDAKFNVIKEPLPYTIAWRRICSAEWDDDSQSFIPCDRRIKEESYVLVFMDMKKMCELIDIRSLDTFMDEVKMKAANKQVILMLEGLEEYYKARQRVIRRRFESTVLSSLQEADSSDAGSSNRKRPRKGTISTLAESGPSREMTEETLTYLQVVKDIMLLPTENEEKTVDWILNLTMDMGHALYNSNRCGADATDTWFKMLQEIQLCTPSVAKSITETHGSLQSLFREYESMADIKEAEELLADIQVERNAVSNRDRTVNKAMSKKIYTIFMTDDPTHVIA
ncbi:putative monocarboxylate transporter mch1 [Apophysomyces ossiformis]|uniref:Putative monocarboxylate transporter mch1 n=1 Tax=Apophysomyces ossiformis TaxID=679940 RepID=A0A8H7ENM0_9FUNG|nr:putative monocarboxylate transporter mch1 [Apophysomyces ossiformis]